MVIFIIVVYFAVSYLSHSNTSISLPAPDILGVTYHYLPPGSQEKLKNLNTSPAIIYIQDKFNLIKKMSGDFPQKQITEIKKALVQTIYQNVMKSIDNPSK